MPHKPEPLLALWSLGLSNNDKYTEVAVIENSGTFHALYSKSVPLFIKHLRGIVSIFLDMNNISKIYKHIVITRMVFVIEAVQALNFAQMKAC